MGDVSCIIYKDSSEYKHIFYIVLSFREIQSFRPRTAAINILQLNINLHYKSAY